LAKSTATARAMAPLDGAKLREERLSRIWTHECLAELADLSVSAIERFEREGRKGKNVSVRARTLFALAGALDVDPRNLLVGGGSRPLGDLGSPLELARLQATRLERRESEALDRGEKGDLFWREQWGKGEDYTMRCAELLAELKDEVSRREASGLQMRFIGLYHRGVERYLAFYGLTPQDVASDEPLDAGDLRDHEKTEEKEAVGAA